MVQKFQSPVRVYKYTFELVMKAYERRFPRCPQMPIVLDCEVINEEICDNGSKRNTTRRCKLAVDAPYIFKKLIGVEVVYFLQHNYLDLANRTLNIEAINESFSSRIEIFERCRYYVHPENPDWTCFDQTATLDIKNFFGLEHSMEKMGMKQYTQTTLKGKEIIEHFINELREEGITEVEKWIAPDNSVQLNTKLEGANEQLQSEDTDDCETVRRKLSKSEILIDGEFISRHLGQLSPMQESKLLDLYKMLAEINELSQVPDYQTILRFLRARDWHVCQAFAMLKDSLQWRKENNIDSLVQDYKAPAVVTQYFPGGWHHYDIDGRPIFILRLGHMDVKGLLKSIGVDGLLKLSHHVCEEGIQKINESAESLGKPVLDWCLLVDLEGLSMRHLWRPGVKALLSIIESVESNYPETLGRVLVVRAPRVFPIAWTIVSTFINDNTRSKFLFFGGPECLHMRDSLEQCVSAEFIPDFLGGPCETLIPEGSLVPKKLYKTNSVDEGNTQDRLNNPNSDDNIVSVVQQENHNLYKTVDLKAGYTHEVLIRNNDPKSVLTWDFDVHYSNIHFSLYRVIKNLPQQKDAAVSFYDLNDFIENVNFFKEEPTLICHPKESVQGSHIMNYKHNYVLHWFSPTCGPYGPAQLNYFYEVLSSANYKGSMTSLQSGLSGNSNASSYQSR